MTFAGRYRPLHDRIRKMRVGACVQHELEPGNTVHRVSAAIHAMLKRAEPRPVVRVVPHGRRLFIVRVA